MVKRLSTTQRVLLERIRLCEKSGYRLLKFEGATALLLAERGLIFVINSVAWPNDKKKEENKE